MNRLWPRSRPRKTVQYFWGWPALIARAFSHGKCVPRFSLVLVAFDLEESASQGSLVFVQDFLLPSLLQTSGANFQVKFEFVILNTFLLDISTKTREQSSWTPSSTSMTLWTARTWVEIGRGLCQNLWTTLRRFKVGFYELMNVNNFVIDLF